MTSTTDPTMADAANAVRDFAEAAGRLLALWEPLDDERDRVGFTLTETYPTRALPMSFDEIVAELGHWADELDERTSPTMTTVATLEGVGCTYYVRTPESGTAAGGRFDVTASCGPVSHGFVATFSTFRDAVVYVTGTIDAELAEARS